MNIRDVTVLLVAVMVVISIVFVVTNCSGSDTAAKDGVDSGVVVERSRRVVVVLEDDGERDKHSIHKRSNKCPKGSRWPDCKR